MIQPSATGIFGITSEAAICGVDLRVKRTGSQKRLLPAKSVILKANAPPLPVFVAVATTVLVVPRSKSGMSIKTLGSS